MDTSKTYVKMCEKAEEIQSVFNKFDHDCFHDFIWCPSHELLWHKTKSGCLCEDYKPCVTKGIWLPRQDQLQGMLYEKVKSRGYILLTYFVAQMNKGVLDNSQMELTSMEQLWLAFVMKEKYNKIWNGKDWINEKDKDL